MAVPASVIAPLALKVPLPERFVSAKGESIGTSDHDLYLAAYEARPCRGRRGRTLRLGRALEDREDSGSHEHHTRHDGHTDAPSPSSALPRLFEERLDESLDLFAVDGIAWTRGRGGAVTVTTTSLALLRYYY